MPRESAAEVLMHFHEKQALKFAREVNQLKLRQGDRSICPETLETHLLIHYHSAEPDKRRQCHDCGAYFRLDEDILSGPHGRSKL